jgi:phosphoglycolate phosphatase-like HAD superfamily hydrolase
MPLTGSGKPRPRAIVFDLDRALIDPRPAWRYAVEEAVVSVTGRVVHAAPLVDEYHARPFRQALRVLLDDPTHANRCEQLCEEMYGRSAMKRLLVHDGSGMALDALRGELIDLAAISRLPHAIAIKQAQSTGLDRFIAILSATPEGEPWDPSSRLGACLRFLDCEPRESAFIGPDASDRDHVAASGAHVFSSAWSPNAEVTGSSSIASPREILPHLQRWWAGNR